MKHSLTVSADPVRKLERLVVQLIWLAVTAPTIIFLALFIYAWLLR